MVRIAGRTTHFRLPFPRGRERQRLDIKQDEIDGE
jgi:hypothetical protein